MRLRFSIAILLPAALSLTRAASAEECTEFTVPDVKNVDAVKEAEAAEAAVKLANEKLSFDPEAALTTFTMALSLRTQRCNPQVLVQIAEVRETRNEAAAAWEIYHLVEGIKLIAPATLPADNPWRTAIQKASTSAIRVAKKIGIAKLLVTGADAELGFARINGAAFGDLERPHALAPGKYTIVVGVTGEGFRTVTRDLEVTAGASLDPISVKTEALEILLAPRPSDLEDPSRAEARSKFDIGGTEAAQGAGRWHAAYRAFDASLRAYGHRTTEYNRAVCAERLGQLITARRGFAQVAKSEGAPGLAAWIVKRAKRNIKAIDEQVGRVILHLREPGAVVTVDDEPLEEALFTGDRRAFAPSPTPNPLDGAMPTNIEILLDPGRKHRFVISRSGFETDVFDAKPSPGKPVTLEQSLRAESHLGRNIGIITMAAGAFVMLAGGVIGKLGDGEIKAVISDRRCLDNGDKLLCTGNRKATIGNVLLPVGGVVAAGGAVAALVGWAPWKASGGSRAAVATSPMIGLGVNALFVTGRFQ
jgi:hypothetical protein